MIWFQRKKLRQVFAEEKIMKLLGILPKSLDSSPIREAGKFQKKSDGKVTLFFGELMPRALH